MRLSQRITMDGALLFRLRSFAPFVLLPLIVLALSSLTNIEKRWGQGTEDVWLVSCLLISSLGFVVRCLTIGFVPAGTSGRGTTIPSAATLNRLGMYSIVRNPLYLGNAIMWLGVALATTSGWFVAVTLLTYWLYIERVICAEEAFLAEHFGDDYQDWVMTTPCFLPRLAHWRAPDMTFSLRTVLRREYPGFIALAVAFTFVDFIPDVLLGGEPMSSWVVTDREWVVFLAVAIVIGLTIRFLKKRHLLDTAGR